MNTFFNALINKDLFLFVELYFIDWMRFTKIKSKYIF